MTKSFYFQHDYNSANDHKVLFLRQQFGIEGYGIYWYVIEQLAQNGGVLPLKIIPVIAMQIQTTADKVNAVVRNYELFTIDDDLFFSARLMKQIEFRRELSENGRVGGLKSAELRRIEGGLQGGLQARKGKEIKKSKGEETKPYIFDGYDSVDTAWEELKNNELLIVDLKRIITGYGFKACTDEHVYKAIYKFLGLQKAKGDFTERTRTEIRSHLVSWLNKVAKDVHTY